MSIGQYSNRDIILLEKVEIKKIKMEIYIKLD